MQLSLLIAVGLMLAWVGERIVEAPNARYALTGVGALLIVASTVLRILRFTREEEGPLARVQRNLAFFGSLSLMALMLYALQSDIYTKLTGASLVSGYPLLAGALSVLWPAVLVISLLTTLLMELSFASMVKAPTLEDGRITEAMLSGLGIAFAFIFAFSVQYVATERDVKGDFSYFRVAKAGDATQKLVASFDEPLEVYLFFPPASDAAEAVAGYFKDLEGATKMLKVTRLDHALEPVKAKELGVSGNGTVLLKKGGRKESIFIGTEVEKARTQLRGLDAEVQKRMLQVAKSRRTVYLTAGHGERSQDPTNGMDQRATIEILYKTLQDQNFEVRTLTTAEGLGNEIPKDAAAVFILGPSRSFSVPEAASIEAYAKRGGRLFIALDPESALPFDELMTPLGLSFKPQAIAQEKGTANVRPPPGLGDRINIGTRTFSSHPVVTYLGRSNVWVLMLGAGGLEELPKHPADLTIDFAVRSLPESWNDASGNFEFDPSLGETKKSWGVVAAVERRAPSAKNEDAMRALVLGDSDAVADVVLQQLPGNQYLVVDGFKWLLGDEQLSGVTNTEVDVPLSRTRQQDTATFYATTFLAPLAVIGFGFLARRRVKKPVTRENKS
ncbi:MAG: Gldg family protein [Archangium sp.]|nr:Gldg family protein [Archangium sp.]